MARVTGFQIQQPARQADQTEQLHQPGIAQAHGQAAVTMPIFGPLGQLSGVSPQTTVYAFLLGNGLTNMITPTSSGLLVLLATAQVGWGQWARYILPLFLIYTVLAMVLLAVAVSTGY